MLVRTAGLQVHFEVWRHRICSQVSSFAGQRVNEQGGLKVVFVSSSLNGATGGREEPFAWKERRLGEGRVIRDCSVSHTWNERCLPGIWVGVGSGLLSARIPGFGERLELQMRPWESAEWGRTVLKPIQCGAHVQVQ